MTGLWVSPVRSTYKVIRLSDLVRCLLQPPLCGIDPSIAVIDILLHITHIVIFETPFGPLRRGSCLVLRLETLAVDLRAWSKILLCVCKQIMWACTCQV